MMTSSPLLFLARLEVVALVLGGVLALATWWWSGHSQIALAVWLGSLFSSGNLRLLIWSWSSILENPSQSNLQTQPEPMAQKPDEVLALEEKSQVKPDPEEELASPDEQDASQEQHETPAQSGPSWRQAFLATRFLFKHFFLLGGLGFCLWGLQLNVVGFSIGLGNIVIAIVLSPLLPQSTE